VAENASLVFQTFSNKVALANVCLNNQIEIGIVGEWLDRIGLAKKPGVVSKSEALPGVVNGYTVICYSLSKLVIQLRLT